MWSIYIAGVGGPYILDDLLHFPKMQDGINNWDDFWRWTFSGGEHAAGRPLSYASFIVDDYAWPTSVGVFKTTNVYIHLFNALLVFYVLRLLCSIIKPEDVRSANLFALVVMIAWAVQPMHMSATFMAIQRMTLLMATFVLLAVYLYLKGRIALSNASVRLGVSLIFASFLFGGFAIFSKEPGILVFGYLLVFEATVLRCLGWSKHEIFRPVVLLALSCPLLFMIAYYFVSWEAMQLLYLKREFTWLDRLLTESRVLIAYLFNIVAPRLSRSGPYQDDFIISTGVLNPPETLLSIVALASFLVCAIFVRKKLPIIAACILLFFVGHSLEGTVIPIELYFEHRNYIPSLGIICLIFYLVFSVPPRYRSVAGVVSLSWLLMTMFVAWNTSLVWGDRGVQSLLWAKYHPSSMRAQLDAVRYYLDEGAIDSAKSQLDQAKIRRPNDAGIRLYALILDRCKPDYPVKFHSGDEFYAVAPSAEFEHASISGINFISENIDNKRCDFTLDELEKIIQTYLGNPKFRDNNNVAVGLYQGLASIYSKKGNLHGTLDYLGLAYNERPMYSIALNQVYIALNAGLVSDAKKFLEKAKSSPYLNKFEFFWRGEEIAYWAEQTFNAESDE